MTTLLVFMATCFILGFGGGLVIGIRAIPERLRPATLLWLSAFYVGLAVFLFREGDPALQGEAARRMDLPERLLPALSLPTSREGDFIYRQGNDYVYASFERGTCMSEHRTHDLDDLLYRVFKDRAWTRTYMDLMRQDLSPEDHAARLAEGQLALLEKAEPRWAARLRAGE